MSLSPRPLPTLLALALLCAIAPASAQHAHEHARPADASDDPFAPVFVVTSRDTYDAGVKTLARQARTAQDASGATLVISEVQTHQLADITRHVHEKERRCGGYFAFASRAEAEAFVRSDRSRQAMAGKFLAAYTIDNQATVNPWLGQVAEANIRGTISHLSTQYPNRYYASTTGRTSAEWIRSTWLGLANGRSDVSAELYTGCTNCSTQPSVILTIQGSELPNEVVVLGAHLDSISNSGSGNAMNAPGADDDASGIATLTEVLRIAMASGYKPKRTVKFMGYAAEEVGLRGSKAIATAYQQQGVNVVAALQLDMTNYRTSGDPHVKVITDYSNASMVQFLQDLFGAYMGSSGLTLATEACGYGCSDHASWTAAGFPSAMYHEGRLFSRLHTSGDTLANMGNSAVNSVPFAKLGLAFLGEAAKTAGSGGNAPPVANFSSSASGLTVAFTDSSSDGDGSIVSRSWNFGDGTTSTATHPSKTYSAAGTYTVTLTVTDDDGATHTKTASVTVSSGGGVQTYTNGTDVNIPDNNATGVSSSIVVSGRSGSAPGDTRISVNIQHPYKGDLVVDLIAPDGSVYNLHNRSGGSADHVILTNQVINLSTELLNGTWRLRASDRAAQDVGYINSWSLTF
ncbi:M20/M25/M40 family metallo-hydrolase [Lysobacter silvisoli]|uniref:M20/M25/M40 family metallo-hydrolase n=1 Tax=Lysobacter silvisoli TaxID=2293254 RepID=A0A371K0Z7_9GAMM|nr:M20/M25/M40 family metallo-hydrolase [Lysobacter silvisoli]RDZ27611.1 M20/M25/M40 family metallo-hydrolase [Lysobacter silvisoli]